MTRLTTPLVGESCSFKSHFRFSRMANAGGNTLVISGLKSRPRSPATGGVRILSNVCRRSRRVFHDECRWNYIGRGFDSRQLQISGAVAQLAEQSFRQLPGRHETRAESLPNAGGTTLQPMTPSHRFLVGKFSPSALSYIFL